MATIKSYTDLSQSKTLSKILPLESSDMYWDLLSKNKYAKVNNIGYCLGRYCVYAWSLAALLDILPTKLQIVLAINDFQGDRKEKYVIGSVEHDKYDCYADNAVDACVDMIIRLHKQNLL